MDTKEKETVAVEEKEPVGKVIGRWVGVAATVVLGVGAVALIFKKMSDIENGNL